MADHKSRSKSKGGGFLHIAKRYRMPSTAVVGLLLFPFFLILLLSFFSLPVCYDLHPILWGEGKIVETTQFIIFLSAAILNVFVSWRTAVLCEKMRVRLIYLLLGLGMFFIAGEEIAWGQQLLHFKIPEVLQAFNVQNELTFHNIGFLQARSDFLNLLFAIAGLIGVVLTIRGDLKKIAVPAPLFPWLSLILILAVFGIAFKIYLGDRPLNYPEAYIFHIQTETAELLIAWVGLLYPWLNFRHTFSGNELGIGHLQETVFLPPALFPVKKRYATVALATGLICMVWLGSIPGEEANALYLGLSRTRIVMLSIGILILVFFSYLLIRANRDKTWRDGMSQRLNQLFLKSWVLWILTFIASLVCLSSGAILIITYTQDDPYLSGILTRLAPWIFWFLVLSLETLFLIIPILLPNDRYQLHASTRDSKNPKPA